MDTTKTFRPDRILSAKVLFGSPQKNGKPGNLGKIPYHPTHIARLEKDGKFPKRIQLGANRVGWSEFEIDEWIEARKEERNLGSTSEPTSGREFANPGQTTAPQKFKAC